MSSESPKKPKLPPEADFNTIDTVNFADYENLDLEFLNDYDPDFDDAHPILDKDGNINQEYLDIVKQMMEDQEELLHSISENYDFLFKDPSHPDETDDDCSGGGGCRLQDLSPIPSPSPRPTVPGPEFDTEPDEDRKSNNFLINTIAKMPPSLEWLKIISGNDTPDIDPEIDAYNDLYDFNASAYDPASTASSFDPGPGGLYDDNDDDEYDED